MYEIYRSEFNKEKLDDIRTMTLHEYLIHRDFILYSEDLKSAHYKDEEIKMQKRG